MTLALKLPALLIMGFAVSLTLSTRCLSALVQDDKKSKPQLGYKIYQRNYENHEYGFAVEIPDGHAGVSDASPYPQHGFYIGLEPSGKIWVDGSYNSLMWESLETATDYSVDQIRKESQNDVSVEDQQIMLGGLRARQTLVRYRVDKAGTPIVQLLVVAIRTKGNAPEIVYTLRLLTTENQYNSDKAVFDQVVRGFRLKKIRG